VTRDGDAPAADTATEAGGGQDTNGASGATSSAATPTGDAPPDKRSDADRTDGDGGSKATRPWRSAKKQAREALARYATAKRQVEELEALGPQRVLGDDFDAAAAGVSSAVDDLRVPACGDRPYWEVAPAVAAAAVAGSLAGEGGGGGGGGGPAPPPCRPASTRSWRR